MFQISTSSIGEAIRPKMYCTSFSDTDGVSSSESNTDSRLSNALPKSSIPSGYVHGDTAHPQSVDHHNVPEPPRQPRDNSANKNLDRRQKEFRFTRIKAPTRPGKYNKSETKQSD